MLEIKNVNKKYGSVAALKNISFSIKENEICGFIGDNGAGKTTTIKSIFGETSIQSGEILFKGKNIFDEYVLQDLFFFPDSNNIPLDLTIDEYLNYTLLLRSFDKKEIVNTKEKVYKLLELEKHHKKKITSSVCRTKEEGNHGVLSFNESKVNHSWWANSQLRHWN
jgi:ABC-2 type transport system ATP-binding protein